MTVRCATLLVLGLFLLPIASVHARDRRDDHRRDVVTCESRDFRPSHCSVPWRDAELVRQTSSAACVRGRTWGIDRGGIWVDKGCAGRFARVGRGGHDEDGRHDGHRGHDGWRPGAGWNTAIRVHCGSQNFRYNMCLVDTGRGSDVRIERQLSNSSCVRGRTWGFNRAGIWVDNGCEAIFRVDRRWR
ncbi:MAG: DUF3011 domain-containing protein [Rhodanobacteraceae bacterium]